MSMTWCSPVKKMLEPALVNHGKRMRHHGATQLRPNPSLKLTRYGRHCKPGLSHSYYRLSPGLQYLPTRAA
jgi:hypothetical protein